MTYWYKKNKGPNQQTNKSKADYTEVLSYFSTNGVLATNFAYSE